MRILHIEDNPSYCQLVEEMLSDLYGDDLFLHCLQSIGDAKNHLSGLTEPYDVLLLDLSLPDASGFEAIDALHHYCAHTALIVLTGEKGRRYGIEALSRGAQDYILKTSCNAELLFKAIEHALGRMKQDEGVKNSLEQLELVLESTGIGTWDWNIQTGEGAINENWARITGYSLAELQPFTYLKLQTMIHPQDREGVFQRLKAHWLGSEAQYQSQYRIKHKDGEYIWVENTGKVVEWTPEGRALRMVGTHHNISDRVKKDEELKKLSRIARDSINGVVITDRQGRIEWVNEGFTRISGYSINEALGKKPRELLAGENTDQETSKKMGIAVKNGEGFHREVINYHKSGREYWIDIQCTPLRDDNRNLQGFMAIETDITEQKKVSDALKRQQQMLEQMSDLGKIGAWEVDLEKQSIYWSKMTKRIHEVPDDYIPDLDTAINFYKEGYSRDTIQKLVEQCIATGEPFATELMMRTAKGREIWVTSRGKGEMIDGKCIRLFGSFQDITERKISEHQLIQAKDDAESAMRAKSEFLATMSHEIRTPINGVIGMLNLLARANLEEKQKHQLNLASSCADSLLSIINDILDYSKVEAGKLELESIDFNLLELIDETLHSVAVQAAKKNIELVADTREVGTQWLKGDPGRLRQVINNIISNAVKFTSEGHIELTASTEKKARGTLLHIQISDTGIGIEDDKLDKLFMSFSQVDSSTTRKFGGTGLGLAISRMLCNLMDGDITVTSEYQKGSTFSFHVNLAHSQYSSRPVQQPSLRDTAVLIFANQSVVRENLTAQLAQWQANVNIADNIGSLQILQRNMIEADRRYDYVFLDWHNKQEEIQAAIQLMQQDELHKPAHFIALVAEIDTLDEAELSKHQLSSQLHKPVTANALVTAIEAPETNSTVKHEYKPENEINSENDIIKNSHTDLNCGNILLVEDNRINQEVALGLLNDFGYDAVIANNGEEAIDLLNAASETPYSLILMDCLMPVKDGYETACEIRAGNAGSCHQNIPILAMTANAMKGDREKCLSVGMNDYISKPIDAHSMLAKIKKWINEDQNTNNFRTPPENNSTEQHKNSANNKIDDKNSTWDFSGVLARVNGKEERIVKLASFFMEDMDERIQALVKHLNNSEYEEARALAHNIKGISANLGAVQLVTHVKTIEQSIIQLEFTDLSAQIENMVTAFEEFLDVLTQYTETRKNVSASLRVVK